MNEMSNILFIFFQKQNKGIIMVNFYNSFISSRPKEASVHDVISK